MSRSHKITSYVPHSHQINSFESHKDFLRKKPSKVIQIKLLETVKIYSFPPSYSKKLIKLLRHLKGLKRLSIDHYQLRSSKITLPSMILLMKRAGRVQELNIDDLWISIWGPFKTPLNIWMKYVYRLQSMTYKLEIWKNLVNEENSFSSRMRSFLKALKYQNQIKSLKIQLPLKASFVNPILLQSTKYPRSLQSFQFLLNERQYEGSNGKLPTFDFFFFKQLRTFALQITDDHAVVSHIIDNLSYLSSIKNLAITLPRSFVLPEASPLYGPDYYNLDSQAFCNLTHLSMKVPYEYTKITLLERLNLSNLRSFQLSFRLDNAQKYQEIFQNLTKMKHLKSLKLSITYYEQLEGLTKHLFENIAELELLTCLGVFLVCHSIIPNYHQKRKMPSDALTALKRIFRKPVKIEEFSLECKGLIISHEFEKLMEVFNSVSVSNFKKFKLDTVAFGLEEGQIGLFARFIECLRNLRALKLHCFNIDSNELLRRLVSAIMKLKKIESISLEKIGGKKVEKQAFLDSLERILEKRGLCSFKCDLTDDFERRIGIIGSPLPFENILKKNPYLKYTSENLWPLLNKKT